MIKIHKIRAESPVAPGEEHPLEIEYTAGAKGTAPLRVKPREDITIENASDGTDRVELSAAATRRTVTVKIKLKPKNGYNGMAQISVGDRPYDDECMVELE